MRREVHSRELQLLDAVRRKYMHNQSKIKEVELKRMDDEIKRKVIEEMCCSFIYYLRVCYLAAKWNWSYGGGQCTQMCRRDDSP